MDDAATSIPYGKLGVMNVPRNFCAEQLTLHVIILSPLNHIYEESVDAPL
jgi:hypothetical protein